MNKIDERLFDAVSKRQIESLLPELNWLDSRESEMLQLVLDLCNQNSGSYNLSGLQAVSQILVREFGKLGGDLRILDVDKQRIVDDSGEVTEVDLGQLIHVVKRPELRPRFLLCIHMDTVYSATHPFQGCRTNSDGTVIGPGVADAKGGLVVMLYALFAIENSSLADRVGWEVIINPDEELGSPGSASFLHQRASLADLGILFEPKLPDGKLVSTRMGVGNFAFVVRGRSAHSGRDFMIGRNALVACCQLMSELDQLNGSPEMIVNVGKVNGGAALNVVPDLAVGRVNVRVRTPEAASEVEREFLRRASEHTAKDGIDVQMVGGFTSPPKPSSAKFEQLQAQIEACALAMGQTIGWQATGGASDGNKFAGAGLVNIDTLGPIGGEIHSENEYLNPESLVGSSKLASLLMLSLIRP